jgi:hypothetical protein
LKLVETIKKQTATTLSKPSLFQKLIKKDLKYKYSLLIPLASATSIPELEMAPMKQRLRIGFGKLR